ncbi:MAG: hypothetical protein ACKVOP_00780 [Sphingomonadaceae bacterium]
MKTVLMIMPVYSDRQFAQKRDIVNEICVNAGCHPLFPEYERNNPMFDVSKARRRLEQSDLVIADLTLERPSCYFELGFAENQSANIIVVADEKSDIHQLSGRERVIRFAGVDDYHRAVTLALHSGLGVL